MKVEGIALRDFPFAEDGEAIRRVLKGEPVRANVTTMRAWRDAGKVRFDEPADEKAKASPSQDAKA